MSQGYGSQGTGGEQPQWGAQGQSHPQDPFNQQGQQQGQQGGYGSPAPGYGSPSSAPASYGSPASAPGAYGSPTTAPGGYPGTAGSGGTAAYGTAEDPGKRALARKIGLAMVILSALVLLVRLGLPLNYFLLSGTPGALESGNMGVGSGILSLLVGISNLILSLALLVLGILGIIQFRGKARTGSIIVVATIVLSVPLTFILGFIVGLVAALATGVTTMTTGTMIAFAIVELLRVLLVGAALILGSMMVQRWGKQTTAA